jgi:hypothetical protein
LDFGELLMEDISPEQPIDIIKVNEEFLVTKGKVYFQTIGAPRKGNTIV